MVLFPITVFAYPPTERELMAEEVRCLMASGMRNAYGNRYNDAFFGGAGCSSGRSVKETNATYKEVLIDQMKMEFAVMKYDYKLMSDDILKIKNRNTLEKSWVFIFGGDENIANRIEQNAAQFDKDTANLMDKRSQCNCDDRIEPIVSEFDLMINNLTEYDMIWKIEKYKSGVIPHVIEKIISTLT